MDEGFILPASELQKIVVAADPTAGKGLALDETGRIPSSLGGSQFTTGDYKISAQTASHADSTGGTWYLCDGSATVGAGLIALVGATLPDARGRNLTMKGTHVDVDAIGDSDGAAIANRRQKHNTTITDPGHSHSLTAFQAVNPTALTGGTGYTGGDRSDVIHGGGVGSNTTGITAAAAGGSGIADSPSFVVPGSLFIHS